MFKAYEIDNRRIDKPTFFRLLAKYFPEATTLYLGGSEIAEDVKACCELHENEEAMHLSPSQDMWTHRCLFSQEFMEDLAALSMKHDFVDLLEHLSLKKKNELLLQWHNVLFDGKIWISDSVPEEMVSNFAQELGARYLGLTADDLCVCALLSDIAIVSMGTYTLNGEVCFYEEACKTLEEVKARGEPYDWLSANRCRHCGQYWLMATEMGHIDIYCLRRLTPEAADRVLKEDIWPSNFDKYATLLRLGKAAGIIGGWIPVIDPSLSSIPMTMAQLARESPGIHVFELAELLNLDLSAATMFAEKVVREEGVRITFGRNHRNDS
jgi:hypothetical protein